MSTVETINYDEIKRLDTLKSYLYSKLFWIRCSRVKQLTREEILFMLKNPQQFIRIDRYCNCCGKKKLISEFKNSQEEEKMRRYKACRNKK
jgi:hypothetical protein